MKKFTARAYNTFRVDETRSIIIKSSDTKRLNDEIGYYADIHETELSCFFPRMHRYEQGETYKLELEHYGYDNLFEHMSSPRWHTIAQKLDEILELFAGCTYNKLSPICTPNAEAIDSKLSMYVDKTLYYHQELLDGMSLFKSLDDRGTITVNGQKIYTLSQIWKEVESCIGSLLINEDRLTTIHGDLCFSNILYCPSYDIIRFIDPRGSFGKRGMVGDPLYDVAKLRHSYSGLYEYIIYDKFELDYTNYDIKFSFTDSYHEEVKAIFENIQRFNDERAKLIEGLIFIGMCSRHYDSIDRQIIMYSTGLQILNEVIK